MARIETKMPDGSIVVNGSDDPPVPFKISKPELRKRIRAMGAEPMFDELLNSDLEIRNDWDDAPWLMSDNETLTKKLPEAAAKLGIPLEAIHQLIQSARFD
jgi:hypothetical protein